MKNLTLFIALLLGMVSMQAQNLLEDLQAVQKAYAELNDFKAKIRVKVTGFSEGNMEAEINKSQDLFLTKVNDNTLLVTTDYVIIVNDAQRSIIVNQRPANEVTDFELPGLKELPAPNFPSEYLGQDGIGKHYQILSKGAPIEQTDLWIDPASHLIQRIEYQYAEQEVSTVVEYYQLTTKPEFEPEFFSMEKFLVHHKKGLIPAEAYAEYQIVNNTL